MNAIAANTASYLNDRSSCLTDRSPWLGARPTWLITVLLCTALLGGCYETEFYPADAGNAGIDASQDGDAALLDAADGAADTAVDSADATEPDAADSAEDSTPTEDSVEIVEDADAAAVADGGDAEADSDAIALLPLGHTCTQDLQCDSGICLTVSDPDIADATTQVCSEPCTGECPAGLRCGLDSATGSTSVPYCLPLPGQLCKPCSADSDCGNGTCVPLAASKESLCGVACGTGGTCPTGFVCQQFLAGEVCVPQLGTCTCGWTVQDQQWSCAASNKLGSCLGTQTCTVEGWTACTAPMPTPELCDSLDNDCNGTTDEAYPQLGSTCGIGACAGGKYVCAADKKGVICSTEIKKPAKDICNNGLDDNCDGKTDENCPPKDADKDGTPDLTDCQPYLAEYRPGATESCCASLALSLAATSTTVDALTALCDFNCDGLVSPCGIDDADKDGYGLDADCNDKDAAVHPGAPDKCADGVDADCDGADAVCDPGNDQDDDGWPVPYDCQDFTDKISPGVKELCNNIDDDCDGVTDDGNPGGGASCGVTLGACKAGTLVCTAVGLAKTATVACVDLVGGEAEVCNGKDDNCDGQTDENYVEQGLGTKCDSEDGDLCANGVQVCAADGLGLVCGQEKVRDLVELCKAPGSGNGLDEDCDGQTDEVCWSADIDGDGVIGAADCNENDAGYSPKIKKEVCCDPALGNGDAQVKACDKNCDGQVIWCDPADQDKDGFVADDCNPMDPMSYPGAPEVCGDGIDQDCLEGDIDCAQINDDDGDKYANGDDCSPFDPAVNPGAKEQCNGKDDDCNGAVDDGNPGGGVACGSAVGACKPGINVCTKVSFKPVVLCVPQKSAGPELCNGLDDNCNGTTDEYFSLLGQPCDGPDSDSCQNGLWTCGADGKAEVCTNESISNIVELCDGLDNDCDGKTDEDLKYFGKPLGATCEGLGACGAGTVVCSPQLQVPVCSTDFYGTEPGAQAETCNGIDDDCDGQIDEDQTFGGKFIGEACTGPGMCAGKVGKVECGPGGKAICSTMSGGSQFAGKPETCNSIDDNCDGHVDEGLTAADSTCKQTGVCTTENVVAKCKAGTWQCSYTAVSGYQPDKEYSCDGLDNDCDGQTDEDFKVGQPCDGADSDLCQNGTWTCSADKGGAVCDNEKVLDIAEECNGKDDDCDGQTDDGFPVGEACDGPDSDQCKNGVKVCTADGKDTECGKETAENITETCNELDDDCNGQVDEGFTFGPNQTALGGACDGEDTDLCANGQVICAADGKQAICGTEAKADLVELCDGVDNNCDGSTDEGLKYQGKPIDAACTGIGACGPGTVVCSPQTLMATCSTNPDAFLIFNGKELCDGIDNDCNGNVDDNLSFNGVPLGQACESIGECGAGKVECGADKQVVCSTQKGGSASQVKIEVCDAKDNDCNGKIDEGLSLSDSTCKQVGVCISDKTTASCLQGQWLCDYSQVPGYQDIETQCDGLDNDCDGQTDEGFDIGAPCDGPDSDACKKGTWACSPDGSDHVCNNEDQTDLVEVCDGADNDCDGQTDEEFTYGDGKLAIGAACDGVGACGVGKVVCSKMMTAAVCSTDPDGTASQAKTETCDGVDNDCDGQVDNGLKYNGLSVGAPCSGAGECGLGVVQCNKGQAVCSTNPDGTGSQAKSELCNGKDDNCDGQTDENLDAKKSSCNQIGVCATALKASCVKGVWKCAYDPALGFEDPEVSCDNVDNNCNGLVDDPYPTKGKACDGADADLCKTGTFVCNATKNQVECNESPSGNAASAEVCDGKDNDCNGQVDEIFLTLGQACDGPDSDSCPNGVLVCKADGAGVMCGDEFIKNLIEVCDGKDNDCNGAIDEGLGLGDPCDGADADSCKNGTWTCGSGGKTVCENESVTNVAEICDGKDNDCDGLTDEGFEQKGQKCDVASDIDTCATGSYQCTVNGALACIGDVACVGGVQCKVSATPTQLDQCICNGGQTCNVNQGNTCSADGKCTCGTSTACSAPKVCSGAGVTATCK